MDVDVDVDVDVDSNTSFDLNWKLYTKLGTPKTPSHTHTIYIPDVTSFKDATTRTTEREIPNDDDDDDDDGCVIDTRFLTLKDGSCDGRRRRRRRGMRR